MSESATTQLKAYLGWDGVTFTHSRHLERLLSWLWQQEGPRSLTGLLYDSRYHALRRRAVRALAANSTAIR